MDAVGDDILQDFNNVSDQIQNLARPPQTKNLGGEWASDRSTPAAKSLYMSIFLDDEILLWFYTVD